MPPISPWIVLAVLCTLPILAAFSARDTLKQRFKNTLDDEADGLRAVEFDGFIPINTEERN